MNTMKLNKDLKIIYSLAITFSVLIIVGWGIKEPYDSPSYINAWDIISNGQIDITRTPTYPIIIGICKIMFGLYSYKYGIIAFQHLLFLISIYFFYELLIRLFDNSKTNFWITLVYGIYPGIINWSNYILTESLAVSGIVFVLFYSIELYYKINIKNILFYMFWLLFLIFLRPSFMYLLPVFLIAWILCIFITNNKVFIVGVTCTMIATFAQIY